VAVEVDDGTVGLDGAAVNVDDFAGGLKVGYFDVGILAALFGEDFYAKVNILMSGQTPVIAVDLAIKNDGGRAAGALASLSIFSSSGETGWKPTA